MDGNGPVGAASSNGLSELRASHMNGEAWIGPVTLFVFLFTPAGASGFLDDAGHARHEWYSSQSFSFNTTEVIP